MNTIKSFIGCGALVLASLPPALAAEHLSSRIRIDADLALTSRDSVRIDPGPNLDALRVVGEGAQTQCAEAIRRGDESVRMIMGKEYSLRYLIAKQALDYRLTYAVHTVDGSLECRFESGPADLTNRVLREQIVPAVGHFDCDETKCVVSDREEARRMYKRIALALPHEQRNLFLGGSVDISLEGKAEPVVGFTQDEDGVPRYRATLKDLLVSPPLWQFSLVP